LLTAQCSHTETLTSTTGPLLTGRLTTRLSTNWWLGDGFRVY